MQTIAIVGLGNIGKKYLSTRHNIGFMSLYTLTEMINRQYLIYESLTYDNTQFLLGDIEQILCKRQENSIVKWRENKTVQGYESIVPLKDFVEVLEQYPTFLSQWKHLKSHKQGTTRESLQKNFRAKLANLTDEYQVLLFAPTTFMNRSGVALDNIIKKYNISKLIVVCDDLDTRFGTLSFRAKGGSGGHNGLKSINQYCKHEYLRVKIGVGNNMFLHDGLLGLLDNEMKCSVESLRSLFYDTFLERVNFNNEFKTKSFLNIMGNKINVDSIIKTHYQDITQIFLSHQKSGLDDVSYYVLSPFNVHELKLLPLILAYNGLVIMGAIFEWVCSLNNENNMQNKIEKTYIPPDNFSIQIR